MIVLLCTKIQVRGLWGEDQEVYGLVPALMAFVTYLERADSDKQGCVHGMCQYG